MKQKVCILFNGDGDEREASKKTANDIYQTIVNKYQVEKVELNQRNWIDQIDNIQKDALCFLATHGGFGEDGSLQKILELKGISHTHSSSEVSAILSNKHLSKLIYRSLGIPTADWFFRGKSYGKLERGARLMVKKPLNGGSKQGIKKVKKIDRDNSCSIFESFITGSIEISVAVVGSNQQTRVFPPVVRRRSLFCSLEDKDRKIISNQRMLRACSEMSKKVHIALSCYGVTKSDFLIDKDQNIWMTETDVIPGMAEDNAVSRAAALSGCDYKNFLFLLLKDMYEK